MPLSCQGSKRNIQIFPDKSHDGNATDTGNLDTWKLKSKPNGIGSHKKPVPELKPTCKVVVVAACFCVNFIAIGFAVGLAVVFVEILKVFETTRALTSLMQSMCIGVIYSGALFIGPMVERFKPGPSMIIGGLTTLTGLLCASFAPNVPTLIVTVGFITAVGLSFAFLAAYQAVAAAVRTKTGMALSVITAGSGLGAFVFPQLYTAFLGAFGWRGTFMIMSGVTFNLCVLGSIVRLLTSHLFTSSKPNKDTHRSKSFCKSLNLHVFKNIYFVCFIFAQLPLWTFITSQLVFIVDLTEARGYTLQEASVILSTLSIAYIPGSLLAGLFSSVLHIPGSISMPVAVILLGGVSLGWVYFSSYPVLLTLAAATGLLLSLADASIPIALLDIVDPETYASALSFLFGISGFSDISSGPISGAMRDITGDFVAMFYSSSGVSFGIGILLLCHHILRMRNTNKTKVDAISPETFDTHM